MSIHSSALVSESAQIGTGVTIGPFAIIGDGVFVGDRTRIDASAQLRPGSQVGNDCHIGSGALISADPHFRGFDSEGVSSGAILGDDNEIREYVTIHRSILDGQNTILGARNYLMNGAHVGHDCHLGDDNTLANNVLLGGHVEIGKHCFFGGGSVVHQFVRIGDHVMTQGLSGMSQDVPHFVIVAGINRIAGINAVGLRRSGMSAESRRQIKIAFREIYLRRENLSGALALAAGTENRDHQAQAFLDFFREDSKKGVCSRYRGQD